MVMHLVQALDQAGFSALFANIRYFGTDTVLSCWRGDTDGRTWLLVSFSKDKAAPLLLNPAGLNLKGRFHFPPPPLLRPPLSPRNVRMGFCPSVTFMQRRAGSMWQGTVWCVRKGMGFPGTLPLLKARCSLFLASPGQATQSWASLFPSAQHGTMMPTS